jgi:hypothetical protein
VVNDIKQLHYVEDILGFILDEAFIRGFQEIRVGDTLIENYRIFVDNEDVIVFHGSNGYEEKLFLRDYEVAEAFDGDGKLLLKDDKGNVDLIIS